MFYKHNDLMHFGGGKLCYHIISNLYSIPRILPLVAIFISMPIYSDETPALQVSITRVWVSDDKDVDVELELSNVSNAILETYAPYGSIGCMLWEFQIATGGGRVIKARSTGLDLWGKAAGLVVLEPHKTTRRIICLTDGMWTMSKEDVSEIVKGATMVARQIKEAKSEEELGDLSMWGVLQLGAVSSTIMLTSEGYQRQANMEKDIEEYNHILGRYYEILQFNPNEKEAKTMQRQMRYLSKDKGDK